jgi:acetyl-CoA decarbonylase/synthase complex subunit gamma
MRWAISRSRYRVEPGLYAVGSPTAESPVLVSANYKMSFDRLRSQLGGLDAWLLVLDTHGVNVWCAAGKGTFGSDELVQRLAAVQLSRVVSHRTVIVPQLGAPGVAAHEVAKRSGFRVVYGPVRAADLPAFLAAGTKATPAMRQVRFPLPDRLVLAPVEMVLSAKWAVILAACLLLLAGLGTDGYSWARVTTVGAWSAALILATCLGSVLLTAILLPWLPGRAFWVRGASLGPLFVFGLVVCQRFCPGALGGGLAFAGWCLLVPAITSFMAMNFTGVTTFTSLSGVRREVRTGGPVQAAAAAAGLILWLVGRFL